MKCCEQYAAALSAFVDEELSENEKEEVLSHVEHCQNCREYLSELMIVHTMFEEMPELDASEGFSERVLERVHTSDDIMRLDALPASLVIIGGGFVAAELDRIQHEYNTIRLHSAIGYVTPEDEHQGRGEAIRAARRKGLHDAAQRRLAHHRHQRNNQIHNHRPNPHGVD